jgi:hypothetical protein
LFEKSGWEDLLLKDVLVGVLFLLKEDELKPFFAPEVDMTV